jgi:hypothetical protein
MLEQPRTDLTSVSPSSSSHIYVAFLALEMPYLAVIADA